MQRPHPFMLLALLLLATGGVAHAGGPRPVDTKRVVKPIVVDGFTLTLTYINCNVMQDLQANRINCNLNINGQVQVPADTKAVGLSTQLDLIEAVDENNRDLLVNMKEMMRNNPQPRNYNMIMRDPSSGKPGPTWFSMNMTPDSAPLMIQHLKGRLLLMMVKTEVVKEMDPTKAMNAFAEIAPGFELKIDDVKPNGDGLMLKVSYRNKGPRNAKWGWGIGPPFLQPLEFKDQDDKTVEMTTTATSMTNGPQGVSGELQIQVRPGANKKVTKVKVHVVTEVEEKPLEFEIKDLLLPMAGQPAPSV